MEEIEPIYFVFLENDPGEALLFAWKPTTLLSENTIKWTYCHHVSFANLKERHDPNCGLLVGMKSYLVSRASPLTEQQRLWEREGIAVKTESKVCDVTQVKKGP